MAVGGLSVTIQLKVAALPQNDSAAAATGISHSSVVP